MIALVLIVDGSPERLEIAKRVAEREGAVAITASDPRTAMQLFVSREPNVTVIQADPSHGVGMGLCRDMKILRAARGRALVIVAERETRQVAFEAGCDAFVQREPDVLPLRRAVRRLLAVTRHPSPDLPIEVLT